jgi:hypothetical protein
MRKIILAVCPQQLCTNRKKQTHFLFSNFLPLFSKIYFFLLCSSNQRLGQVYFDYGGLVVTSKRSSLISSTVVESDLKIIKLFRHTEFLTYFCVYAGLLAGQNIDPCLELFVVEDADMISVGETIQSEGHQETATYK